MNVLRTFALDWRRCTSERSPCPVGLALQDPKGVVVPNFDLSSTYQLLPFDLQMSRHRYHFGCEHSKR